MVSLFSLSQRRMPAFIAVLAILMLFIAPEVSKTLVQWRAAQAITVSGEHAGKPHHAVFGSSMAMNAMSHGAAADNSPPMHGMTGMSAPGMAHHTMPAAGPDGAAKNHASMTDRSASQPAMSGMATMDDLACGYCELLVHFPFIVWLLIPLIWLLYTSTRAPPVRLIVAFFVTFLPGTCLPRAPPAR